MYKYLPEWGYKPHVVTAATAAGLADVRSVPARPGPPDKSTVFGLSEAVLRKFVFPYDDSMLWAIAARNEALKWARTVPFTAVLSTFPPINTHFAAHSVSRKLGVPWIADFRDALWLKGIRDSPGLPGWVDRRLERRFVRDATVVLNLIDTLHNATVKRYPDSASKCELIWNGYDPAEDISALPVPGDRKVLLHAGNLYYGRRPTQLVDSLVRLVRNGRVNPNAVLLRFLGAIDPAIRRDQQEAFEFLEGVGVLRSDPPVPRAAALTAVRQADSLLLLDMADALDFVPAKLFEYIRTGRPIFAFTEPGSAMARILDRSGIPHRIAFRSDSQEVVDEHVLAIFNLPSDPQQPSEWFLSEFNGRRQAGKLAGILDKVTFGTTIKA
jgi:hypothetical protein